MTDLSQMIRWNANFVRGLAQSVLERAKVIRSQLKPGKGEAGVIVVQTKGKGASKKIAVKKSPKRTARKTATKAAVRKTKRT
jgi:hypothetical protein